MRSGFRLSLVLGLVWLTACASTPDERFARNRRAIESAKEKKYPLRKEPNGQEQKMLLAIQKGNMGVLRDIIEKGIDPNTIFWSGERPENALLVAIQAGNLKAVRYLIKKGADVDGLPAYFTTPLISAITAGRIEIATALIQSGAEVNAITLEDWNSPLHLASQVGNSRLIDTLVKRGAFIDHSDRKGQTPLMVAVQFGHAECVQKLLELGAISSLKNHEGKTAADFIPSRNRESIRKLLNLAQKKTRAQNNFVTTASTRAPSESIAQ